MITINAAEAMKMARHEFVPGWEFESAGEWFKIMYAEYHMDTQHFKFDVICECPRKWSDVEIMEGEV